LARERGLLTFTDYHQLYDPRYSIHLIITLTPEQDVLEDIIKTRPLNIRIMGYHVFKIFWEAIESQARKLKIRNEEVETIFNGIQDFITVITPELEIAEANQAFLEKMGYARQEVIGRKCYEVFQQIDQPCSTKELPCPLYEVIRNKGHCRQVRTRLIEKTLFLNSNLLKISGVMVEMDLDPQMPDLVGSEDQLQQVFMQYHLQCR
ncbi:MAG: PAS domain-containing protein, partial [Candidatus Desulfatibia sp.]|uniref:PAS domain-containing protein n=1 Tax=Candidatus Desulfatibia sp. TaxID=3101189 RepID=UPI002F330245